MDINEAYDFVIVIVDNLIEKGINIQISPYNKITDKIGFLSKDRWVIISFYPIDDVQDNLIYAALHTILKSKINFNYSTLMSPVYHKNWNIDYSFEIK